MGALDSYKGQVNSLKNKFLRKGVDVEFTENDFPLGFSIQEILENGQDGKEIILVGNMMPKIPLTMSGSQRMKKDFYAGSSEPVIQVLGNEEDDLTISGKFKAKKFKDIEMREVPSQLKDEIEGIKKRGNLVLIELGDYKRYCILSKTKFDINRLPDIDYEITFTIFGESKPKNAQYINETKELPTDTNNDLLKQARQYEGTRSNIPASVPLSISDQINNLTGTVASALSTVTGFVDSIINTVGDIQKAITRAKGLIKYTQGKLKSYRNFLGSFDPFNDTQSLSGKYYNTKFYRSEATKTTATISTLETLRSQLSKLSPTTPLGRHLVKSGDNLQKISIKFYGVADNWKKIYDYNKLSSTELVSGSILEIPRK